MLGREVRVEGEAVFIMDKDGRIIHDDNVLFGASFTDSLVFGSENAELASQMLQEESGYSTYDSDDAPGAGETGGERLIGWTRLYIEDTWWLIVVTEPFTSE